MSRKKDSLYNRIQLKVIDINIYKLFDNSTYI